MGTAPPRGTGRWGSFVNDLRIAFAALLQPSGFERKGRRFELAQSIACDC
jgi:hypothetical protein